VTFEHNAYTTVTTYHYFYCCCCYYYCYCNYYYYYYYHYYYYYYYVGYSESKYRLRRMRRAGHVARMGEERGV